ncbi:MAG: HPF/RaiA family ribosome-associated protein [Betaproteobacteria bacterium]
MPVPVQIVFHEIDHSQALATHIREKTRKLESFHPKLMSCHVSVEQPHRHKHQGRSFNVRISLHVPGAELVVNRDQDEDVYVVLRDAFDAARRQLEDNARKVRGDVKLHERRGRAGE